jgi:DNA-binding MarR family transcriptional regulator
MPLPNNIPVCHVAADLTGAEYCVASTFRRTTRAITKAFDAALQPFRLSSTQFAILVAVAKTQPVAVGDLANILLVDPSTLSRSLVLMQRNRLVAVSGRSAMRQRFVTLSAQGARKLDDSVPRWRQVQAQFIKLLGSNRWKELQRDFETLSRRSARLR